MTYDEFKKADPIELIKEIYKRCEEKSMPRHLENLLSEVIKEVQNEDSSDKR